MEKINLNKLIAERSSYSRRKIEILLRDGLIKINGQRAMPGDRVEPNCEIEICNKKIDNKKNKKIYIKLNKASGYVCSNKIFPGEKNIFSLVKIKEKLSSIGRLDKDSCGLIILTNDGDLNYKLSHPKFEHKKKYLVKIKDDKRLRDIFFIKDIITNFKNGIDIGEKTLARAKNISYSRINEFEIILAEGKKRQIRRMFSFFDLDILELKRIEFAGIKLGNLKEKEWQELSSEEISILKK